MPQNMSRLERSFRLIRASWEVLRADGELLVLPALSGIATLILLASFVGIGFKAGMFEGLGEGAENLPPSLYAATFLFYVVQYFVVFFFNTALVGAALQRLDGGNPTLGSALGLAMSRVGVIFGYAVISATVGMVLRMISERLGILGRLLGAGAGLAWTITTFLVVPVLASEDVGPIAAVSRSAELLKKTWGENLIGSAGISFVLSIVAFAIGLVGIGGGFMLLDSGYSALAPIVFGTTGALFLIVILVGAALSGIYAASVYYYAMVGEPPDGFDRGLIEDAFEKKKG